jgi:ribosomal protein S18 acetylase RimI-like enzyme
MQIRPAIPADALALAQIKDAIWPDEATTPDYIAQVMAQPDHQTIVAVTDENIVGFVDGFISLTSSGQRRWEVDLLGVHPAHQGQGIGTQLMQAATEAGKQMTAAAARALVAVENIGSQKALAKVGFVVDKRPLNLWVSAGSSNRLSVISNQLSKDSYLIPVVTLNYQGVWLEGMISAASLQKAQAVCVHQGWDVAGVLIPVLESAQNDVAHKAGYAYINQYQWWQRPL